MCTVLTSMQRHAWRPTRQARHGGHGGALPLSPSVESKHTVWLPGGAPPSATQRASTLACLPPSDHDGGRRGSPPLSCPSPPTSLVRPHPVPGRERAQRTPLCEYVSLSSRGVRRAQQSTAPSAWVSIISPYAAMPRWTHTCTCATHDDDDDTQQRKNRGWVGYSSPPFQCKHGSEVPDGRPSALSAGAHIYRTRPSLSCHSQRESTWRPFFKFHLRILQDGLRGRHRQVRPPGATSQLQRGRGPSRTSRRATF